MRYYASVSLIFLVSACYGQNPVQHCPVQCRCSTMHRSVACRGASDPVITQIPTGYPIGTIRVNLDNNEIASLDNRPFTRIRNTLFELTLNNNEIAMLSDSVLEGFVNIKRLELSKNKISNLRKEFFYGLNELQHLQINQNRLAAIADFSFIDLSHLQQLWLSQNRLISITRNMFSGLRNLHALDISNNRIRHIDSTAFTSMTNLRNLYLNNNHLSMISTDWFKLPPQNIAFPMLSSIKLSGNPWRCNCSLYREYNDTLELLNVEVNCFDDNMCILCYTPFSLQLQLLHDIESSHWSSCNKQSKIPKPTTSSNILCESPTICVIVGNAMSQEVVKRQIPITVEILTVINNNFSVINRTDFTGLYKLAKLDLQNNSIAMIEDLTFIDQRKLKELDLQNNNLHSSTFTNKTFQGLSELQTLNLQNNKLSGEFGNGIFKPLYNLEVLFLARNQIKMIDVNTFHGLVGLGELHLSHNKIRSIHHKSLKNFDNLKVVDLEYNNIETLNFVEVFKPGIAGLYTNGNPWKCTCELKQSLTQYTNISSDGIIEYSCALQNLCIKCTSPLEIANKSLALIPEGKIPSCKENVKDAKVVVAIKTNVGKYFVNSLVPSIIVLMFIISVAYTVSLQKRFRGKVKVNPNTIQEEGPESYNYTTATINNRSNEIIEQEATKNNNTKKKKSSATNKNVESGK